jgi:hypothetical protein
MADAAGDDSNPDERSNRRPLLPIDDGPQQYVWVVPYE